uniref:Ig-like domain-containing protein n=1 Tax=Melopsittacus undulatus TaxID=13146 RepID=A0A8V5FST4_MELUD
MSHITPVGLPSRLHLPCFNVSALLCLIGAGITQTSSLVLKEDDKATLTCSQDDDHSAMYWYLQQPGKGLQLIYYSLGEYQQYEGDFHTGYKAQRPNRSDFSLDILSVKMNYSAVYFCASSVNTALQSHFLSLHKRLLPALSVRRQLLSAQEEGLQANSLVTNQMLPGHWSKRGSTGLGSAG